MLMLRFYFLSINILSTSEIKTKMVDGLDPQKQRCEKNIDLLPHTAYLPISTWHSCLGSWRCTSPDWTTVSRSVCKTLGNKCLAMILCPPSKCYDLPQTRLFRSAAVLGNPHLQSSRLAVPLRIDPWPRTVNLVRASWNPLRMHNVHTGNQLSKFPTTTWLPVLLLGKNSGGWAPLMKELPAWRPPLGCDQKFQNPSCIHATGSGDSQVLNKMMDLWLKGHRFESQQEWHEKFSSPGQLSVLTFIENSAI